eukprot:CAMPEP_0197000276 /NCGR_PEP_ID=MMETSP1380-20130617/5257_1 /TAXON_ID=5936 /ORGANISM="Euplotes crassus, Strain CT5" /LENGTH=177 /DNA_ID=CAMNT_0042417511 /DNA_START=214 /DNA_END=745 /DNA_ORIENTATION=-
MKDIEDLKGKKGSAKKTIPTTTIPKSLVNKLVGVLKDSEKSVRKNMRKSASIENYQKVQALENRFMSDEITPRTPSMGAGMPSPDCNPSLKKSKFQKNNSMICIHSSYTKLNNVNMVNVKPGEEYYVNFYSLNKKSDELCATNDKLHKELALLGKKMKKLLEFYRKREEGRAKFPIN